MADPVTIGVMLAVGQVVQGVAAYRAADFDKKVANANARLAEQQSEAEAARQRRLADKRLGGIVAGFGASGVTLEGSPLDVFEDSATEEELDALLIEHAGKVKSLQFRTQAQQAKARKRSAVIDTVVGAGSTLLMSGAFAPGASGTYGSGGLNSGMGTGNTLIRGKSGMLGGGV